MTVADWLQQTTAHLNTAGIETARLDALILLGDALGHDRAWLLAHPEAPINDTQLTELTAAIERRSTHEPLAYIREHVEFYGRTFMVNEHVLVPRPESETIIELLRQLHIHGAAIADIGTGSGALAITAALELPEVTVAAVDVDDACLTVAAHNATQHDTKLELFNGNLLEPFLQKSCNFKPTVLLCNLPYVPSDYQINRAATHEPRIALFGGTDGLDLYRTLFTQAEQLMPALIVTESLPDQHAALTEIANQHRYQLQLSEDFIQAFTRY